MSRKSEPTTTDRDDELTERIEALEATANAPAPDPRHRTPGLDTDPAADQAARITALEDALASALEVLAEVETAPKVSAYLKTTRQARWRDRPERQEALAKAKALREERHSLWASRGADNLVEHVLDHVEAATHHPRGGDLRDMVPTSAALPTLGFRVSVDRYGQGVLTLAHTGGVTPDDYRFAPGTPGLRDALEPTVRKWVDEEVAKEEKGEPSNYRLVGQARVVDRLAWYGSEYVRGHGVPTPESVRAALEADREAELMAERARERRDAAGMVSR